MWSLGADFIFGCKTLAAYYNERISFPFYFEEKHQKRQKHTGSVLTKDWTQGNDTQKLCHQQPTADAVHYNFFSRSGPVPEENSSRRSSRMNDEQPEVRIISLGQEPELVDYSSKEDDEMHRQRILSYKTPSEKLAAVLNVKQQFAQQANAVFQVTNVDRTRKSITMKWTANSTVSYLRDGDPVP